MSRQLSFVKGTVVSISHVFYHSGLKTFFLCINQNDNEKDDCPTFIMAKAENLRTQDLPKILVEMQLNSNNFIGKKVIVKNIARTSLVSKISSINMRVYMLTKKTKIEVLDDISTFLPQPTSQHLVDYEGESTYLLYK